MACRNCTFASPAAGWCHLHNCGTHPARSCCRFRADSAPSQEKTEMLANATPEQITAAVTALGGLSLLAGIGHAILTLVFGRRAAREK